MKQITKYIGMLAILPLVMVALAPNYIGDAEARNSVNRDVVLAEPVPDVNLTLKQVFEPQESDLNPVKGERYSSQSSDSVTYQVVYNIYNSGETDVKNVMISVHSDMETVEGKLSGKLDVKHSTITVLVKAVEPVLINAKIVGYEI